jgi:hypothetical protein
MRRVQLPGGPMSDAAGERVIVQSARQCHSGSLRDVRTSYGSREHRDEQASKLRR